MNENIKDIKENELKELKQLKEGKISLKELAEFFGIAYGSIRTEVTRRRKLKLLKEKYADYHIVYRKNGSISYIVIDKVKEPFYKENDD